MAEVIPALNPRTEEEFVERARVLRNLDSHWVQVDVSDGVIGKPKNEIRPATAARELQGFNVDVHLMVRDALRYVSDWKTVRPTRVTAHIEALPDPRTLFSALGDENIECGLACGPETPIGEVLPFLGAVDLLLLVAVPPGKSGQAPDPKTPERIRSLRRSAPRLNVGVDGGVTVALVPGLVEAGATTLFAASAIFDSSDPKLSYEELKRAARS